MQGSITGQAPAPDADRVSFEWGVRIPMRDGVQLNATVYTPKEPTRPTPCVFTLTPYIAQTYHDRGVYFAAHGYPFLTVDTRGRGNSEGRFRPFTQEANDGYDVVEWLAKQPYCNGKIAMWGGSYAGYNQWATAKEFPPHLATIVPAAAPYAGVDFPAPNNLLVPYVLRWISLTSGHTSQATIFGDETLWNSLYRRWYTSGAAFRDFDRIAGIPSETFQEWVSHPHQDAYWDAFNPTSTDYAKLSIPVLTITGSYDANQRGALTHYRQHMTHATAEARERHYLVIGPWDHAGTRTPSAAFGGIELGEASLLDLPKLHLDWFAWTMQDGTKPDFLKKTAAYYVIGADTWRYADTLEDVTAEHRPYYLDSAANANSIFSSGSLATEPGHGKPDHYRSDPRDLSSADSEPDSTAWITDQSNIFTGGVEQLIYHTVPFEQKTELGGFFSLSAWIAIDQPDTDFSVAIYEVRSDGGSEYMTGSVMRARYRESLREPKLVRTRKPLRYDFDQFPFTSREIQRGSRLRLVISPINSMFWQKNYNSGGEVAEETLADARTVNVSLYHDRDHPSALYVPIARPEAVSDDFVAWAKQNAIEVDVSDPPTGQADIGKIIPLVGSARVVALGEPTHGAHEPLAVRNALFRHLVEQLGFTALAIESGLSESRRVNDFVQGGPGDAVQIVRDNLTWGFGDYAENVDLVRWLREYNMNPAHRRKISFYGIDLTGGDRMGTMQNSRIALDDVVAYLAAAMPRESAKIRSTIEAYLSNFTHDKYASLDIEDRRHMREAIEDLNAFLAQYRSQLIRASSDKDFAWATRNAIVASRQEHMYRIWPDSAPDKGGLSSEMAKPLAVRDAAMADNLLWALEREGRTGRVLVFAHNAHVMNAPVRGGVWAVFREPPTMMGQHLRTALADDYMIVATSSGSDSPDPAVTSGEPGSLDSALAEVGPSAFLLDTRKAEDATSAETWLGELQSMRVNFTTQILTTPREAFDAVLYIDRLSAAQTAAEEK